MSFSDNFAAVSAGALMSEFARSVTYSADGAAGVSITGIFNEDQDRFVDGEFQETRIRRARLTIYADATNGIAAVQPERDTVTVDGDVWTVADVLVRSVGGLHTLRLERRRDTQAHAIPARRG